MKIKSSVHKIMSRPGFHMRSASVEYRLYHCITCHIFLSGGFSDINLAE